MKSVVTGGKGFIGRYVVLELLRRGHEVVIYDNDFRILFDVPRQVTQVVNDIGNLHSLTNAFAGADYVFHLCGLLGTSELFDDPTRAIDVNIKGALNVLLAAKEAKVRKVFFPGKPNGWNNIYSVTAQAVEKLGLSYREHMNVDVRVLRLFNVYGPYQKLYPVRKAVPIFIAQALRGLPVEIFGDGTQNVELLFVRDVSTAIIDYLLFDGNVTTTHELRAVDTMPIRALAERIIQATGSASEISVRPARKGEGKPGHIIPAPDVGELITLPQPTSFNAGMKITIDWYVRVQPEVYDDVWRFYNDP